MTLSFACSRTKVTLYGINGETPDSYNDVDRTEVAIYKEELGDFNKDMTIPIKPHSDNIVQITSDGAVLG
ncbi:hypothetical protein [Paenibacillus terricola]|uniref:hypothetical protein n=1 Tax=Paenibacillus terricola TaxID=2763503 RepID=UPI001CD160B1|nr:hypothetical protein [Paenibacillus terricola]